jgi:hypothetical protein
VNIPGSLVAVGDIYTLTKAHIVEADGYTYKRSAERVETLLDESATTSRAY